MKKLISITVMILCMGSNMAFGGKIVSTERPNTIIVQEGQGEVEIPVIIARPRTQGFAKIKWSTFSDKAEIYNDFDEAHGEFGYLLNNIENSDIIEVIKVKILQDDFQESSESFFVRFRVYVSDELVEDFKIRILIKDDD